MPTLSVRSRIALFLYLLVALGCVFWIPTKIPTLPSVSLSYIFGYNNRAGILLLVLSAAGFGLLAHRMGIRVSSPGPSDRVNRKLYWLSLAAISLFCLAMYVLTARPGSFGESAYMIDRLGLAAKGLQPYRDFEFAYGAALLYGPLLIGKALHIGYVNGYYVFWWINALAGVWLLRFVIDSIDLRGTKRTNIFLLMFWMLLIATITTGTNYSGLRFLAAPALALWIYRYLLSARYWFAAGATCLSFIVVLLLSPELAIGFAVGFFAYLIFFWSRARGWSWCTPYAISLVGIVVALWLANKLDVFITLRTFARGGISLPIVPAAHILFLIFVLMLVAIYLVTEFFDRHATNTTCLLLITLTALPSALGHCDPGHVFLNTIPMIVVAFLWSSTSPSRLRWVQGAVVFLLFISMATFLAGYAGQLWRTSLVLYAKTYPEREPAEIEQYRQKMTKRFNGKVAEEKVAELRLMEQYDATVSRPWRPPETSGIVQAPFGYSIVQDRTFIDEGYYAGTSNAFNPDQIEAKVVELRQHPEREVLIPGDLSCYLDVEGQKKFLSVLFFYPFRWSARHSDNLYNPICRYIAENYTIRLAASPDTYGFTLWSPKAK